MTSAYQGAGHPWAAGRICPETAAEAAFDAAIAAPFSLDDAAMAVSHVLPPGGEKTPPGTESHFTI